MIIENVNTGQRFEVADGTHYPESVYRIVNREEKAPEPKLEPKPAPKVTPEKKKKSKTAKKKSRK